MSKIYYVVFTFVLQFIIPEIICQGVFNQCFSLEVEVPNIEIDSNSIWEIGQPSTFILNNSYNSQNSIVTKLDTNYISSDSSFFQVFFEDPNWGDEGIPSYLGSYHDLLFEFDHRFILDTLSDHGEIEFSIDNGNTWYNIVNEEELGYCTGGCLYNSNYFESTDQTVTQGFEIIGDSEGWVHSAFEIVFEAIVDYEGEMPVNFLFRFRLVTDSLSVNEGWQIDNLCATYQLPNSVFEFTQNELKISPNPNNGNFSLLNFPEKGILKIYSSSGKLVFIDNVKSSKKINTDLKSGIYFVQIIESESIYFSKLIVN